MQLATKTIYAALLTLCLSLLGFSAKADDAWVDLLDGGTLDAWRGYRLQEVPEAWQLDDQGVLMLNGQGGDLVTREQYGDFEFQFEWKISEEGNSGIMYRVSEDQTQTYETGPEYQVLDDQRRDVNEPRLQSAAIYGLYAKTQGSSKLAGEWNTGKIVLNKGHIEHWLNGLKVSEAQLGSDEWNERVAASKFDAWKQFGKNARGHIALQDHGDQVWYRNMKVRRLNETGASAALGKSSNSKRVLFVTQSAGFRHSAVTRKPHELSHAERSLKQMGIRSGKFRVDVTQDVENEFTPELLANYDAVVFYTTGKLPIPKETLDWFLQTWLAEEGHGFLGVHAAADTYKNYEPYWDMLGGTFNGHPWNAETKVVLKLHESDHPAAQPWGSAGDRISITDEIYRFKNWQPEKVRVLMSLDMERTEIKQAEHVPILWVKPYGAGRVMHMSLGHREDVWDNLMFQDSLIAGLGWLMGDLPGDATPNPELSSTEQAAAEQAAAEAATAGG